MPPPIINPTADALTRNVIGWQAAVVNLGMRAFFNHAQLLASNPDDLADDLHVQVGEIARRENRLADRGLEIDDEFLMNQLQPGERDVRGLGLTWYWGREAGTDDEPARFQEFYSALLEFHPNG